MNRHLVVEATTLGVLKADSEQYLHESKGSESDTVLVPRQYVRLVLAMLTTKPKGKKR